MVSSLAFADVYKYTDKNGHIYFTDRPKHKKYKLLIRTRPKSYNSALKVMAVNKKKYAPIILAAARKHKIDEALIHAVIRAESAYDANAISSAGAVGLMQLMPGTAKQYGALNRTDPKQNVFAGTRYLKYLISLFPQDLKLAIAAYNAGESTVKRYKNTIPPYPETQKYVRQVLRFYQKSHV
ncbi:MAG: transglycosylase SLT domain-containing protein [Methyloprofundus sp.]|nr:transglycosylase SLT domain-containing protein [Methyloprofundus sp.]